MNFSVVVPVGEGDCAWKELLPSLSLLEQRDEVVFVSVTDIESTFQKVDGSRAIKCPVRFVRSTPGRARQLNRGAQASTNDRIWFLHCDSKFESPALTALRNSAARNPECLHFFNLRFLNDGPRLILLNNLGAWIRSRVLRMPFGDQGLCIGKKDFIRLGEFREDASYGEDHLLIWRAHQFGISLSCVGAPIFTSARKYKTKGWSRTTVQHLIMTYRQAIPEFFRLIKARAL